MRGISECRIGRRGIPVSRLRRDVVRRLVPNVRRTGERARQIDDRGKRLVANVDCVDRVLRLYARFRDDHRDRLADEARGAHGERVAWRRRERLAVGPLEISGIGQRLDALAHEFVAGDDANNAGHCRRRFCIDRHDARVRMRRAQKAREHLIGQ